MVPDPAQSSAALESLLIRATDDYLEELRRGGTPDIERLALQYPTIAQTLRDVLPALSVLDRLPSDSLRRNDGLNTDDRLGNYRIGAEIGRGGMGVVYEAHDERTGERVALKVLSERHRFNERQQARFTYEARAAASLCHPHIVRLLASGCDNGRHYYAMQYIEGCTIAELLRAIRDMNGGALERTARLVEPWRHLRDHDRRAYFDAVARIGLDVALALAHAHERSIVHRDIKPDNLLLDTNHTIWLADFGLARHADVPTHTQSGEIVGTLRYMSPEQAQGHPSPIDARSDLYSLGASLYELITLQPVVSPGSHPQVIQQLLTSIPKRCRSIDRQIPPSLEAIIMRTLEKEPSERYASAQWLADDLARFLRRAPLNVRPLGPASLLQRAMKRHPLAAGLVSITTCAIAIILAISAGFLARSRATAQKALETERQQQQELLHLLQLARTHLAEAFVKEAHALDDRPAMTETQLRFLEQVSNFYHQLPPRLRADPALQMDIVRAHHRLGLLRARMGQHHAALGNYRAALTTLSSAPRLEYAHELANASIQLALADTQAELGDVEQVHEAHESARTALLRAGRCHQEGIFAAEGLDANLEWLSAQFDRHQAALDEREGRVDQSKVRYQQAVETFTKEAKATPEDLDRQLELSSCIAELAAFLQRAYGDPQSSTHYRHALHIAEQVRRNEPNRVAPRKLIASIENDLALVLFQVGDLPEAQRLFERALDEWQRLATDYPAIVALRQQWANAAQNLASLHYERREFEQAETLLRTAKTLAERNADDSGTRATMERSTDALQNLLRVDRSQDKRRQLVEVVARRERDVARFPTEPARQARLAASYMELAPLCLHQEGTHYYELTERLVSQLMDRYPDDPDYRAQMSSLHDQWATYLQQSNDRSGAEAHLQRSLEITRPLVTRWPHVADYHGKLGRRYRHLGQLAFDKQKWELAAARYAAALAVEEQLVEQFPGYSEVNMSAACALTHLQLAASLARAYPDSRDEMSRHLRDAVAKSPVDRQVLQLMKLASELLEADDYIRFAEAIEAAWSHRSQEKQDPIDAQSISFAIRVQRVALLANAFQTDQANRLATEVTRDLSRVAVRQPTIAYHLIVRQALEIPGWGTTSPSALVSAAQRLVCLTPSQATAWQALAAARFANGQWRETLAALEVAADLDPDDDLPRLVLRAECFVHLGDLEHARPWQAAIRAALRDDNLDEVQMWAHRWSKSLANDRTSGACTPSVATQ